MAHPEDDIRSWIRGTLIPSGGVTVAEVDGRIAGLVAVSRQARVGWIDQLCVAPESLRRGIGTRLLARARETLTPLIRLYTFQDNQRARAFYEHHGFRAIRFGDGSGNEEHCPDVLFEWTRD
jgi:ribosomal protein S18 acetylase RimI-like enzyme